MIKLDIVNMALAEMGVSPLASLDEDNEKASLCSKSYDSALKYVLTLHNWNFAIKIVGVSLLSNQENNTIYEYVYLKPSDLLKIISVMDNSNNVIEYDAIGNNIYTKVSPIKLKYIAYIDNVDLYPSYFIESLKYYFAFLVSTKLINNNSLKELFLNMFSNSIDIAKHIDAQEGKAQRLTMVNSHWLESRY